MRRALVSIALLTACAPEATIEVIEPPFLVDSYPGNGSVIPADQASPLLFRFSKDIADAATANQHITLEVMGDGNEATGTLPVGSCSTPTQPVLLECSIDAALDAGTRYRVTIGTGLSFLTGEALLSPHQRWFQTLPSSD